MGFLWLLKLHVRLLIPRVGLTVRQDQRGEGYAHNKSIANSGAGRWSNRQQFAFGLLFRLDVCYLAFCCYLHQMFFN